jgi:uncharacterized protein
MHLRRELLALCLVASACDPREGRPPRPVAESATREPRAAATGSASAKPVRLPGRCVVETPPEPSRPAAEPARICPPDDAAPFDLERATVGFEGSTATVSVERAVTNDHRMRGLMFRTYMPENEGMLFEFEEERDITFWMKNTCISLDMIFIAADGLIVGIEENTPTLTTQSFAPGVCRSRYVLEVNAGWARKNGVRAGMRVKLP